MIDDFDELDYFCDHCGCGCPACCMCSEGDCLGCEGTAD